MTNHQNENERPFVVCPGCQGHGTRANPAFDGMSLSSDTFEGDYDAEMEFRSEYFRRGGMYDVRCFDCDGNNVVRAECECDDCEAEREEMALYEMERRSEMRMGC